MLKAMRRHAKYFYFLFGLVIVSFVLWVPQMGDEQGQGPVPLARVGQEEISLRQFWLAYDRAEEAMRDIYREEFDEQMRQRLREQVLQELLTESLLYQAALELGLRVSEQELQEAILNEPAFMRDGVFRKDIYFNVLRLNRLSPAQYEALKRRELLVQKMRLLITEPVKLTPQELEALKGEPETIGLLQEALLAEKRRAAVQSFLLGLRKRLPVVVNEELIS